MTLRKPVFKKNYYNIEKRLKRTIQLLLKPKSQALATHQVGSGPKKSQKRPQKTIQLNQELHLLNLQLQARDLVQGRHRPPQGRNIEEIELGVFGLLV